MWPRTVCGFTSQPRVPALRLTHKVIRHIPVVTGPKIKTWKTWENNSFFERKTPQQCMQEHNLRHLVKTANAPPYELKTLPSTTNKSPTSDSTLTSQSWRVYTTRHGFAVLDKIHCIAWAGRPTHTCWHRLWPTIRWYGVLFLKFFPVFRQQGGVIWYLPSLLQNAEWDMAIHKIFRNQW